MPVTKRKAFAYITNRERLLLLVHPDHPEAGIQVPAGTMEPEETPEDAVLREAAEETDLAHLTLVRLVGRELHDARPFGKDELHDRWFFHLRCDEETPDRWRTFEEDPFEEEGPILFELLWVPIGALPPLSPGHDRFISELMTDMYATRRWKP